MSFDEPYSIGCPHCQEYERERLQLEARVKELEKLAYEIDMTLRVPAAEYVPAIQDVFTLLDQSKVYRAK